MLKKYLVIGNYGNYNIGDETILKGLVKELLSKESEDIRVYIPTRNEGYEKLYHNELKDKIFSFYVYNFKYLLRFLKSVNEIIIGGGGIWSRYTGSLGKIIPLFGVFGKLIGKKISFRRVGIYTTASPIERMFVNLAILISNRSTVRDYESYNVLWKICRKKTIIQNDFAIEYLKWLNSNKNCYTKLLENSKIYRETQKISKDKFVIGLSIKPTKNPEINKNILKEIKETIDVLNDQYKNIHFIFFPFSKTPFIIEDDFRFTNNILKIIKNRKNISILPHTNPIIWYFVIKDFIDAFIGMRYHSLIFAWIAGKPFFGISYENKNINFLTQIKHAYWDLIENIDANELLEFIKLEIR